MADRQSERRSIGTLDEFQPYEQMLATLKAAKALSLMGGVIVTASFDPAMGGGGCVVLEVSLPTQIKAVA